MASVLNCRPVGPHCSQNSPIMAGAKRKREIQDENSEMHHHFQHQKVVAELKRRRVDGLHDGHSRKVKTVKISLILMFILDLHGKFWPFKLGKSRLELYLLTKLRLSHEKLKRRVILALGKMDLFKDSDFSSQSGGGDSSRLGISRSLHLDIWISLGPYTRRSPTPTKLFSNPSSWDEIRYGLAGYIFKWG